MIKSKIIITREMLFMKGETLFLKVVVFLLGLPVLVLCVYGLPWIAKGPTEAYWRR